MFPKDKDVEVPLLKVLLELGGEGKSRDIISLLTKRFPKITKKELEKNLLTGDNKWETRIDFVKFILITKGEIDFPRLNLWSITDKGRKRVNQ